MSMIHHEIMRLAELRNGFVTEKQLLQLGLTHHQIAGLLKTKFLQSARRGVYRTTTATRSTEEGIVICLGAPHAVLSLYTAAEHWGLRRTIRGRLEISIPKGTRAACRHARVRRTTHLPESHVVTLSDGRRFTTPARTLFDLAAITDPGTLRSMIEDALERGLVTYEALLEMEHELAGRGRPGSAVFRSVLGERRSDTPPLMSENEITLEQALLAAGLPVVRQHPIPLSEGHVVHADLARLGSRLALKVDHPEWHADAVSCQRDKSRDNALALVDWESRRFTDRDVDHRLGSTVALIRMLHERRVAQAALRARERAG
jgi:transcriptional regulator with AbiEi antitoxin domain of type IV toxin-antitoxin system